MCLHCRHTRFEFSILWRSRQNQKFEIGTSVFPAHSFQDTSYSGTNFVRQIEKKSFNSVTVSCTTFCLHSCALLVH
jgi:hypothetical protein